MQRQIYICFPAGGAFNERFKGSSQVVLAMVKASETMRGEPVGILVIVAEGKGMFKYAASNVILGLCCHLVEI